MNVLFVCLGNICRSPMAAACMKKMYQQRGIEGMVHSAGTENWHEGRGADSRSIAAAHAHGLDLTTHRARQVKRTDLAKFDVVYAMDSANERELRKIADLSDQHKIRRLRIAAKHLSSESDVPDPYEGDMRDFERTFELIRDCCARVVGELIPGVRLERLSAKTLLPATQLIEEVFPRQWALDNAGLAFRLSLHPDRWLSRLAFRVAGVTGPRYWVAIDSATQKVVGVTGAYENIRDQQEALWGGWTCVHPDLRGQGLGRAMFCYVIDQARRAGKKYCRAYTSTDPKEAQAQALYELMRMQVVRTESYWMSKQKKVFREIRLS